MTDGPLIVQSDKTVLLEVDHEQAGAARAAIAPFAELLAHPSVAGVPVVVETPSEKDGVAWAGHAADIKLLNSLIPEPPVVTHGFRGDARS